MSTSSVPTPDQHVDAFLVDAQRIVDLLEGDLDAAVPTCPGWTLERLATHVGRVLQMCTGIVETRSTEPPGRSDAPRPTRDELPEWLASAAKSCAAALAAIAPEEHVHTWAWGPAPASFWHRRIAHELAIHRVDAELAAGVETTPHEPVAASDGVDEWFATQAVVRANGAFEGDGETVHLHVTDLPDDVAGGEWLLTCTPDGAVITREHAKGDVAFRGRAEDLFLALWNRRDWSAVEAFGADDDIAAWRHRLATAGS